VFQQEQHVKSQAKAPREVILAVIAGTWLAPKEKGWKKGGLQVECMPATAA